MSVMNELKVFIADDEEPARERLKTLLGDIAAQVPTSLVGEARLERAVYGGHDLIGRHP